MIEHLFALDLLTGVSLKDGKMSNHNGVCGEDCEKQTRLERK